MPRIVSDFDKLYFSTEVDTPLGRATLASDGVNLVGLWLQGQKYFGGAFKERLVSRGDVEVFEQAKDWLHRYFAGKKPLPSELPLLLIGSEFRLAVWNVVKNIPYGKVLTYNEVARRITTDLNKVDSYNRAVGGAVSHNPLLFIIPCHRVVGKNDTNFYAAGADKKAYLLNFEGADISTTRYPLPFI